MDDYTRERVTENLDVRVIGRDLRWHDTLPSTNGLAMHLAETGAPEGTVVIAEEQSAGRGRRGREWVSPRGGIWLSVILRPGFETSHVPLIALAASVAAARAIRESTGLQAGVKWPNDVLVGGAKAVGILAETGPGAAWVVVGIGINVNVPRALLPADARYPATSLAERAGSPVDRVRLTRTLLGELDKAYAMLGTEGGAAAVLRDWRGLSETLGQMVRVEGDACGFEGRAIDVDSDGALLVRLPGGRIERVLAGDVTVRGSE